MGATSGAWIQSTPANSASALGTYAYPDILGLNVFGTAWRFRGWAATGFPASVFFRGYEA